MTSDLLSGVYQHFKGFYCVVLGLAIHTETKEKLVIYIPLGPQEGPRIKARPLSMFLEEVEVDGLKKPRFTYIGVEMPKIEKQ